MNDTSPTPILLTGSKGQLGQTLSQHFTDWSQSHHYRLVCVDVEDLDISNSEALRTFLSAVKPELVINAAAYTAVDAAEENVDLAMAVNCDAAAELAEYCAASAAHLIHVSTDFVFDGAASAAYCPDADTVPLGVYGASKLAGEDAIRERLPVSRYLILRTSWLYSEFGNNFVKTMLRLMAERDRLSVVSDQIGSPTSTHSLTEVILSALDSRNTCSNGNAVGGTLHWCDGGSISWYDFAVEIQRQAMSAGILDRVIDIEAIPTSDYPTPARRPAYSVLDCSETLARLDCPEQNWRQQLQRVIDALKSSKAME